jgi:hypothetical protein
MAIKPKLLGQQAPGAATETALYDCPRGTIVGDIRLVICNTGAAPDTVRVSLSAAGAATTTKDYLYYDLAMAVATTFSSDAGVATEAGDIIRVRSALGTCSFSLFGDETYPI